MRLFFSCAGLMAMLVLLASGCTMFDTTCEEDDRDCLSNALTQKGVGGECSRSADCKLGLACTRGTCQPTGRTATGGKCRLTAECGSDDYCGSQRSCQLAGDVEAGNDCSTTSSCQHGLVCDPPDFSSMGTLSLNNLAEVSGLCREGGDLEQGKPCDSVADCLAGLTCIDCASPGLTCTGNLEPGDKVCFSLPPTPFELPAIPRLWPGVECAAVGDDDPLQSYFDVPRGGEDPGEFYSLPFPNDIRLRDGHIDLSTHPVAPDDYGLPFVDRYIQVAQEDLEGFSTNPVIFFRFSHPYNFASVTGSSVRIVDITPASPDYDDAASIEWKTTSGNLSNYICPHWLAFRRPVGEPLRAGTTYAAIITTAIKPCVDRDDNDNCVDGQFTRGDDFAPMLASSAPSDSALRSAWQLYQPLRDWIEDTGQNANSILNAAVFTTQDPEAVVRELRATIEGEPPPEVADLTECASANTDSPCAVGDRGQCMAASGDFTEVHGHIELPIFQQGTPPYLEPEDGGGFELDAGGAPLIQRREQVCFAISVPSTPAPAEGYPVLVYAHGTGGVFNGEMDSGGFAQTLATAPVPAVLVAIDLPQHGERRGDTDEDPEGLFYNFLNPRAARDNVLQGAADLMSVVRWVKQGGVMVGGQAVAFDTTRIGLMGHSQGSTHTALMGPYEPDAIGIVLSGNGGHLATSMLTKTSPVDIASVVPIGLLDPDDEFELAGGGYNPALAIIQSVFDRADPINYAHRVYLEPPSNAPSGHHLFMTYGLMDTYSPVETQAAYARAGILPLVGPRLEDIRLGNGVAAPLHENQTVGGTPRTVGLRQYTPRGGIDGHFVGTRSGQDGRADVDRFLQLLLAGQPPEIGP